MYTLYGTKKCGGMHIGQSPCGTNTSKPPEPDKIAHNRFPRCCGCPYPRHGLFCWTDSETCLRTEMAEIEGKSRNRRSGVIGI